MTEQNPYALLAVLALAFIAGWSINGWRLGEKIADLKAGNAEMLRGINEESERRLAEMTAERDAKQSLITKIDLERLKNAQQIEIEMSALRAAVADGRRRLSVRASCPAAATMPKAATGSGMDASAAPELDPGARQDYFTLRAGIVDTEAELAACKRIAVAQAAP